MTQTYHHAALTAENDLSKTDESQRIVSEMGEALGRNAENMSDYFSDDFRWMGNTGCGVKNSLEEFRRNWQKPFRAAFHDRVYVEEARVAQGEWVSAFGYIEGTHAGEFMGIAPTGKRVTIKWIDFWHVKDGKIVNNWVSVDYPHVLEQLGRDVFDGEGWEAFDRGDKTPPGTDA